MLHGLYRLCAQLAEPAPLVLAVDDAQWADAPSLRFLAFLLPRLEELPVVVLVGAGTDADPVVAPLLGVLRSDLSAQVLRPAPLSEAAVGELIAERLAAPPAPAFAAACHAATGGQPFLVRELLAAVAAAGVAPDDAAAAGIEDLGTGNVAGAIAVRLARLPPAAGALARALAVLETAELSQAAALAEVPLDDAAMAADVLVAAGIAEPRLPLTFVHPIVRGAVLAELPAAARAQAHRRAAALLATRDVPAERVAEHLLATEPAGEPWVVEHLVGAARTAVARGAPDCAATYLCRALAEPPVTASRPRLLLELGQAESAAGDDAAEGRLREALARAADDDVRLAAALALAHLLGRAERMAEAVEVIEAATATLAGGGGAAAPRLEAIALGAGMLDAATAPAMACAAARYAPGGGRPGQRARGARRGDAGRPASQRAGVDRGGARPAHARHRAAHRPRADRAAVVLAGDDRADLGRCAPPGAGARSTPASRRAAAAAIRCCSTTSLAHRSWLHLRRGDLAGAEIDARAVLETADAATPELYRRVAVAILGNALLEQGDPARAAEVLAGLALDETESTHTAAVLRLARGRMRLAERRPGDALADILAAGDIAVRSGALSPGFLAWRSAAAQAHAMLGELDAAAAVAAEEVALARAFGARRTLGVALRTAGVVTGGEAGEALLRESVHCLEQAGVPLERGAGAGRARGAPAAAEPAAGGARAAARGARYRPARGSRGAGGAGRDGAARGGRAAAAHRAAGVGGAHRERAAGRRAGRRRPHEPRDRAGAVRHRAHRGRSPDARVHEARRRLAARAAGAPRRQLNPERVAPDGGKPHDELSRGRRAAPDARQRVHDRHRVSGAARRPRDTDVMKVPGTREDIAAAMRDAAAPLDVLDVPGSFMTSAGGSRSRRVLVPGVTFRAPGNLRDIAMKRRARPDARRRDVPPGARHRPRHVTSGRGCRRRAPSRRRRWMEASGSRSRRCPA